MSNKKVLVVDDEEDIRDILEFHINSQGWCVDVASSPIDALKMLKSRDYFMLITDLAMPKMNGYELIKEVKELYPSLFCSVITGFGYDTSHSLVKLNQEFDCPIFLKPFDFKENLIGKTISTVWDQYQITLNKS